MVGESKEFYGIPSIESSNNETELLKLQQNNLEKAKEFTNNSYSILPNKEIGKLNFGIISTKKNEKLVSYLNTSAEGNDSIDGLLSQNEQVQLLLSEILSDYNNYIGTDKQQLATLIQQEKLQMPGEQTEIIESMYEYMLDNDNEPGFENFITTNGINSIKTYLSSHLDNNGKFSFISKNEIKTRLKIDWIINLYKGYKEKYTENSEALDKLGLELDQFGNVANYVNNSINNGIKQYLLGGFGKDELAQYLNQFLTGVKENKNLQTFLDGKDRNSIIGIIRYGIKEHARLLNISDKSSQLQYTGDKVFDMQIRSYLYLYGLIAYPDKFTPEKGLNDDELWEILRGILITYGIIKDDGKDEMGYVESEKKLCEEQARQDIIRRKNARSRINSIQNRESKVEGLGLINSKNNGLDIQHATGVEIVQDKNLGSQIIGFNRRKSISETDDIGLQKAVLMKTGEMFIKNNQGILSDFLEIKDVPNFFNVGNNGVTFNRNKWEDFKDRWKNNHPEDNQDKLNKLLNTLLKFPNKYKENLKKSQISIDKAKDKDHETIKDYALGAVIDNIKDMFKNIVDTNSTGSFMNGFEFDEKDSARIENNCLLLSGKFNGETINIKYNLNTGKLYMNSFINESTERIIIGGTKPDDEIGELKSFDAILDDFYDNPIKSIDSDVLSMIRTPVQKNNTNNDVPGNQQEQQVHYSEIRLKVSAFRNKIREEHKIRFQKMCGTKLDEMSCKIKDKVESKSIREPIVLDLLKTLGVMPKNSNTINLSGGSDLYKIVQLITSRKNTVDDMNTFSAYMKTFVDYVGLDWGKDNAHQDKTKDIAKIIFDEDNKQENIIYIRDNTQNFDNEHLAIQGNDEFDKKSTFGILKIIEEKFTEGEYPNWKLSSQNIKIFKNNLERNIVESRLKRNEVATTENKLYLPENWA